MSVAMGATWTDTRVALLKKLWPTGISCAQIAAQLGGVTRNAVIGKVTRLGLERRWLAPRSARKPKQPRKTIAKIANTRIINVSPPIPLPPVQSDVDIPAAQRRTLAQLTNSTCRWPIGMPGTPGFFFCGAPADCEGRQPYCDRHHARAHDRVADYWLTRVA
jgi:GcrA cell cycle regulator